jgi:uncharacterized protein YxjI
MAVVEESNSNSFILKANLHNFGDPRAISNAGKEFLATKSNSWFFFDHIILDKSNQAVLRVTKDVMFPVYRFYVNGQRIAKMEPKISTPVRDFVFIRKFTGERIEITGDFFNFNFKFTKHGKTLGSIIKANGKFILNLIDGEDFVQFFAICIVIGRQIDNNEGYYNKNIFR